MKGGGHLSKPSIQARLPRQRGSPRGIHAIIRNDFFFHGHNFLALHPKVASWFLHSSDPAGSCHTGAQRGSQADPQPLRPFPRERPGDGGCGAVPLRRSSLASPQRDSGWAQGRETRRARVRAGRGHLAGGCGPGRGRRWGSRMEQAPPAGRVWNLSSSGRQRLPGDLRPLTTGPPLRTPGRPFARGLAAEPRAIACETDGRSDTCAAPECPMRLALPAGALPLREERPRPALPPGISQHPSCSPAAQERPLRPHVLPAPPAKQLKMLLSPQGVQHLLNLSFHSVLFPHAQDALSHYSCLCLTAERGGRLSTRASRQRCLPRAGS